MIPILVLLCALVVLGLAPDGFRRYVYPVMGVCILGYASYIYFVSPS